MYQASFWNLFLVWERFLEFHRGCSHHVPPSCSYVCTHPLFRDFRRKGHPLIGLMDSPKVTTVWIASSSPSPSPPPSSLFRRWNEFSRRSDRRCWIWRLNWEDLISRCRVERRARRRRRRRKIKMRKEEQRERERQ